MILIGEILKYHIEKELDILWVYMLSAYPHQVKSDWVELLMCL